SWISGISVSNSILIFLILLLVSFFISVAILFPKSFFPILIIFLTSVDVFAKIVFSLVAPLFEIIFSIFFFGIDLFVASNTLFIIVSYILFRSASILVDVVLFISLISLNYLLF